MTTNRESKRIPIEQGLSAYYSNKLNGKVWALWDESKRAYRIRGDSLPAHPDMQAQYPNGWSMLDYVTPTKAAKLLGLPKPIREQSKRILSVTVKREADYDADTSELGKYSDTPNDYAIVNENLSSEYGGQFVRDLGCECSHAVEQHNESEDYAIGSGGIKCSVCECEDLDRVTIDRGREYRYYNPPIENYDGSTDEELRTYAMQDYKRIRDLDRGEWCCMGVTARAVIQLNGDLTQTIRSGGLWGMESDSEKEYFTEVEGEQLGELREQLHAIGFTKRAIAAAFRNVQHTDH